MKGKVAHNFWVTEKGNFGKTMTLGLIVITAICCQFFMPNMIPDKTDNINHVEITGVIS